MRNGNICEKQVRDALKENEEYCNNEKDTPSGHCHVDNGSLMDSESISFNFKQQEFLNKITIYLQSLASGLNPPPELILLHGGPGVGKTHTIVALQQLAESLGNGVVVCAPTGSAAANIPHGKTIHSTFGFRVHPNDMNKDEQLPPMPVIKMASARLSFHNKNIFLIDEMSMLGPIGLGHINQRLQEITNCFDRPFGGLMVILSGDAYQLQPVCSKSLYSSVVKQHDLIDLKSKGITPSSIGSELFSRFVMFELTEQMRTDDVNHISLINHLRDPSIKSPINDEVIKRLTEIQLVTSDVNINPDWTFAPIVVTLNEVRANLNFHMACRFAKLHKLPVIKWRIPISGLRATSLSSQESDQLYDQEQNLWGVFVKNAPGYLTFNINPSKSLANGTPIIYESLSFSSDDKDFERVQIALSQIANAGPGEVIELQEIPYTINVSVPSIDPTTWPVRQTLEEGRVLIPIFRKTETDQIRVRPCGRFKLSGSVDMKCHAVELGFAITYEKVQGKTMKKIILDLNQAPSRPLSFSAFYTGITRVRKHCDLKILSVPPGLTLQHLKKLTPDPTLICWLNGFDKFTGHWRRTEPSDKSNQSRGIQGISIPTNKRTAKGIIYLMFYSLVIIDL